MRTVGWMRGRSSRRVAEEVSPRLAPLLAQWCSSTVWPGGGGGGGVPGGCRPQWREKGGTVDVGPGEEGGVAVEGGVVVVGKQRRDGVDVADNVAVRQAHAFGFSRGSAGVNNCRDVGGLRGMRGGQQRRLHRGPTRQGRLEGVGLVCRRIELHDELERRHLRREIWRFVCDNFGGEQDGSLAVVEDVDPVFLSHCFVPAQMSHVFAAG
jgi:hypothetical protein